MKIDTAHLRQEVEKVLNEDGLSAEELSIKAGISRVTIYRIMDDNYSTTQRAIARKIAEGTGRKFKIEGDKIYFFKPEQSEESEVSAKEIEMLKMYRELDSETQSVIAELIKLRAMKKKSN